MEKTLWKNRAVWLVGLTILLLALAFTTINVTLSHLGYYDITLIVLVDLLVFVLFMTMVNKRIRKNGAEPFV